MGEMVRQGFLRARVDGAMVDLETPPDLDKQKKHTIEIVVDRLVVKRDDETRRRLADSLETATKVAGGLVTIAVAKGADGPTSDETLSTSYACPDCGTSLTEITPRLFSFNSPFGACPALQRPRGGAEGRPGAARPRPGSPDRRRGDRPLQAGLLGVAAPADRAARKGASSSRSTCRGRSSRKTSAT